MPFFLELDDHMGAAVGMCHTPIVSNPESLQHILIQRATVNIERVRRWQFDSFKLKEATLHRRFVFALRC
ncbi:MAG: hypothetical protein CFE33_09340 [Pseudorhodobacter sp. PARRP1]|nr:MAG: hypothetical protein CFE33_09340 [Pseudorhodobacter sp. PARRP1]